MSPHSDATPRAIFDRQIACIRDDDRDAQLRLYAEDCTYEFPFATDRPRRIAGREEFRHVMEPLWEEARRKGVRIVGYQGTLYETADPELVVAEFTLSIDVNRVVARIPFVQFIRVRHGRIVEIREYFSPQARSEALDGRGG